MFPRVLRLMINGICLCLVSSCLVSCSSGKRNAALDRALEEVFLETDVVGISAAVRVGSDFRWRGAAGWSDPEKRVAMDSAMSSNIGSTGKFYMAVCALKLAEAGKLDLDAVLGDFLDLPPRVDAAITIRQIMNHTSGVFDFVKHPQSPWKRPFHGQRLWRPAEVLESLLEEPYFPPGEGWHYSTTNYMLLQMVLSKAGGSPGTALLKRTLLETSGLEDTRYFPPGTIPDPTQMGVKCWLRRGDNLLNMSEDGQLWETTNPHRIHATAMDVATFFHGVFFYRSLLSEESLAQITRFHSPTPGDVPMSGYGLGLCRFGPEVSKSLFGLEAEIWGHPGSGIGYRAFALYWPKKKATLSVWINEHSDQGLVNVTRALLQVINGFED